MPYRFVVQSLIAASIGLVLVGAYLGVTRGGGGNEGNLSIKQTKTTPK